MFVDPEISIFSTTFRNRRRIYVCFLLSSYQRLKYETIQQTGMVDKTDQKPQLCRQSMF